MRKLVVRPLHLALLASSLTVGCLPIDRNSSGYDGPLYSASPLFSENWPESGDAGAVGAIAYDPASDNIFFTRCVHIVNNEVHRYNFASAQTSTVYSYLDQLSYGARVLGGELYIARSYDNTVIRLNDLTANTLNLVKNYGGSIPLAGSGGGSSQMLNVNDMALANGNLYFVTGGFTTSSRHNGIQSVPLAGATVFGEWLSSAASAWGEPNLNRSIVSLGSGASTRFAVATGGDRIELRDVNANLLASASGYPDAYLQTDSMGRIYAMTLAESGVLLTRWSTHLTDAEVFPIAVDFALSGGNGPIFVLKELPGEMQIVFTKFRAHAPEVIFYSVKIPD